MNNQQTIVAGLKPLIADKRDFQVGQFIDLPQLHELPESFRLPEPTIKNQYGSDFCAAFASSTLSEIQEGVVLSETYQFALIKSLKGNVDDWGADLRTTCQSYTKIGSIPRSKAKYSLDNEAPRFLRDIKNWDAGLILDAAVHKKQSYFKVKGPYDSFDDIRATIWHFNKTKDNVGILIGVEWGWNVKDVYISEQKDGFGHAMAVIGWVKDHLVVRNSAGAEAGENGNHYIHRDVINRNEEIFGAFGMIDVPREVIQYHIDSGTTLQDNWLIQILKSIKSIWVSILNALQKK